MASIYLYNSHYIFVSFFLLSSSFPLTCSHPKELAKSVGEGLTYTSTFCLKNFLVLDMVWTLDVHVIVILVDCMPFFQKLKSVAEWLNRIRSLCLSFLIYKIRTIVTTLQIQSFHRLFLVNIQCEWSSMDIVRLQ